ncbi:MAG: hypothetical protein WCN95_11510 [bacterium]
MNWMADRRLAIAQLFAWVVVLPGLQIVLAQEIGTNIVDCAVDVGKGAFVCGERHGNNLLIITNGGTVKSMTGYIGHKASSHMNTVIITGDDAVWNDTTGFDIGDKSSFNSLILVNRGRLNCTAGYLGYYANANSNSATVSGNGSVWTMAERLHIGCAGAYNTVVITNGGVVNCGEGATIGPGPCNSAIITGKDSVWNVKGGSIVVGGEPGSSLILRDDGSANGAVVVKSGSMIVGSGTIDTLTMQAGSMLSPGDPIGKLTLKGNCTLDSAATNVFELGSAKVAGVDYDYVEVQGTLDIANMDFTSFIFKARDGFGPGIYTLINAGVLSGDLGSSTKGSIGNLTAVIRKDTSKNNVLLTVTR